MMLFDLPGARSAGAVEIDAILSEGHSATADVTRHPVERGADVSDHIVPHPKTLEIVGAVSDFPVIPHGPGSPGWEWVKAYEDRLRSWQIGRRGLGLLGPARALLSPPEPPRPPRGGNAWEGRTAAAWAALEELRAAGQLVRVVTGLGEYDRMAIKFVGTTRDAQSSSSLMIRVSLEEVRLAVAMEAAIPPGLLAPKNLGKQATRPADAATATKAVEARNRSLLHRAGGIFGVFD